MGEEGKGEGQEREKGGEEREAETVVTSSEEGQKENRLEMGVGGGRGLCLKETVPR